VLIKLRDRLHNMPHRGGPRRGAAPAISQGDPGHLRAARPTGSASGQFKAERRTCLRPARAEKYHRHGARLQSGREQRQVFVRDVSEILSPRAGGRRGARRAERRSKNVYSIIDKMGRQQKEFEEIYDLMAVRVVVDSVRTATPRWAWSYAPLEAG